MHVRYHSFHFAGIEEYNEKHEEIDHLLFQSFGGMRNYAFLQAVEEAANNAVAHMPPGNRIRGFDIFVRVMAVNVAVTVQSASMPFDARAYQSRLMELAESKEEAWMQPILYEEKQLRPHMGFWIILMGSDYVYMEEDGQSVTLVKWIFPEEEICQEIGILARRFFVRNKDGCLLSGKAREVL